MFLTKKRPYICRKYFVTFWSLYSTYSDRFNDCLCSLIFICFFVMWSSAGQKCIHHFLWVSQFLQFLQFINLFFLGFFLVLYRSIFEGNLLRGRIFTFMTCRKWEMQCKAFAKGMIKSGFFIHSRNKGILLKLLGCVDPCNLKRTFKYHSQC